MISSKKASPSIFKILKGGGGPQIDRFHISSLTSLDQRAGGVDTWNISECTPEHHSGELQIGIISCSLQGLNKKVVGWVIAKVSSAF